MGFVTRGKGVSIHRADCSNFAHIEAMHPERVIETEWGGETGHLFAADPETGTLCPLKVYTGPCSPIPRARS